MAGSACRDHQARTHREATNLASRLHTYGNPPTPGIRAALPQRSFVRPTRTSFPDGTYEETVYEGLDAVRRRDRLGRWSHTFYDSARRVAATRDAAGRTVRQEWCDCGSLDRLVDPSGNATAWEYDVQGRVTKETRANGSFRTTVYEATTSRLKKTVDAKLQEKHYTYGRDDAVANISYVNAEHPTPGVTYSYIDPATGAPDAHGRVRQVTDGTGTTVYAYHPFGQLGAGQVTLSAPGRRGCTQYAKCRVAEYAAGP
jgi:YD repeat-containing protein